MLMQVYEWEWPETPEGDHTLSVIAGVAGEVVYTCKIDTSDVTREAGDWAEVARLATEEAGR